MGVLLSIVIRFDSQIVFHDVHMLELRQHAQAARMVQNINSATASIFEHVGVSVRVLEGPRGQKLSLETLETRNNPSEVDIPSLDAQTRPSQPVSDSPLSTPNPCTIGFT